jgi:carbon-monoxide dehydrogenase small subunit
MRIKLWINGKQYEDDVREDEVLLNYLRKKGCYSVKCGCETTNCGLCTVWIEEKPVLSCGILVARADGKHIVTLEGLQEEAREFGKFMAAEGADQCGYCNPGFVMNVLAMKKELVSPTRAEVRNYLAGNLCRCTGYMGQMRAVEKYLGIEEEKGWKQ